MWRKWGCISRVPCDSNKLHYLIILTKLEDKVCVKGTNLRHVSCWSRDMWPKTCRITGARDNKRIKVHNTSSVFFHGIIVCVIERPKLWLIVSLHSGQLFGTITLLFHLYFRLSWLLKPTWLCVTGSLKLLSCLSVTYDLWCGFSKKHLIDLLFPLLPKAYKFIYSSLVFLIIHISNKYNKHCYSWKTVGNVQNSLFIFNFVWLQWIPEETFCAISVRRGQL